MQHLLFAAFLRLEGDQVAAVQRPSRILCRTQGVDEFPLPPAARQLRNSLRFIRLVKITSALKVREVQREESMLGITGRDACSRPVRWNETMDLTSMPDYYIVQHFILGNVLLIIKIHSHFYFFSNYSPSLPFCMCLTAGL